MSEPTPEEIVKDQFFQETVLPSYVDVNGLPDLTPQAGIPMGVDQGVAAMVVRTPKLTRKCTLNLRELAKPGGKLQQLPSMFEAIANDAAEQNLPTATLVVGMYGDDTSGVLPGQYVAQLHLVVHRMPDDKEFAENVPVARG